MQLHRMGAIEFFESVKQLIQDGKVEMVTSPMYHPLIPLTPKDVVARQIANNNTLLKRLLGVSEPHGFFSPELAISRERLDLIHEQYAYADEHLLGPEQAYVPIAKHGETYLLVNNRDVSSLLRSYPGQLSARITLDLVQKRIDEGGLIVTGNDAELFGHHYSERLRALSDLLDSKEIVWINASEAIARFRGEATLASTIVDSTWQDCERFSLWNKNALQQEYLSFQNTVYELTTGHVESTAEDFLDQGYSSCYLYWLSHWPWWHPGLVENGAENLIRAVRIAKIEYSKKAQAETLYHDFLHHMWQYQWSGHVEEQYQQYNETKNRFLSY